MALTDATGQKTCHQKLTVCSRYIGSQHIKESNMALIEIGFVSGYEINKASLTVYCSIITQLIFLLRLINFFFDWKLSGSY